MMYSEEPSDTRQDTTPSTSTPGSSEDGGESPRSSSLAPPKTVRFRTPLEIEISIHNDGAESNGMAAQDLPPIILGPSWIIEEERHWQAKEQQRRKQASKPSLVVPERKLQRLGGRAHVSPVDIEALAMAADGPPTRPSSVCLTAFAMVGLGLFFLCMSVYLYLIGKAGGAQCAFLSVLLLVPGSYGVMVSVSFINQFTRRVNAWYDAVLSGLRGYMEVGVESL